MSIGVVVWLQTCLSGVTFINESHEVPRGKLFLLLLLSLSLSLFLSHSLSLSWSLFTQAQCTNTHSLPLTRKYSLSHSSYQSQVSASFVGSHSVAQKARASRARKLGRDESAAWGKKSLTSRPGKILRWNRKFRPSGIFSGKVWTTKISPKNRIFEKL